MLSCIIFLIFGVVFARKVILAAPAEFQTGVNVRIPAGSDAETIAKLLTEKQIIKSPYAFIFWTKVSGSEKKLFAGDYFFDHPISLGKVLARLKRGIYGLSPTKVTIYEGTSNLEIANLLARYFRDFDKEKFIEETKDLEGYLFPDTYYFLPSVTASEAIFLMNKNFSGKISELGEEISKSSLSLHEIITMASLIEEEASREKDRRLISGVLWNRLRLGIPLQVDATFRYINGKNTYQLTLDDLKIDSPYNTYLYKGLPPGPITNPGLDAIEAALNPIESKYLFYLADRRGNTYFAKTFEEHKRNRVRYLR